MQQDMHDSSFSATGTQIPFVIGLIWSMCTVLKNYCWALAYCMAEEAYGNLWEAVSARKNLSQ